MARVTMATDKTWRCNGSAFRMAPNVTRESTITSTLWSQACIDLDRCFARSITVRASCTLMCSRYFQRPFHSSCHRPGSAQA